MDFGIIVAIDFLYAIAILMLISLGLAIIFGMMQIINLAHGEFMMMGSYSATVATITASISGSPMLLIPPLTVGAIGIIVERSSSATSTAA